MSRFDPHQKQVRFGRFQSTFFFPLFLYYLSFHLFVWFIIFFNFVRSFFRFRHLILRGWNVFQTNFLRTQCSLYIIFLVTYFLTGVPLLLKLFTERHDCTCIFLWFYLNTLEIPGVRFSHIY